VSRTEHSFHETILRAADFYARDPHQYNLSGYEGRLLMLKFFGDDSRGRNEPGYYGCCCVAGYLADADEWRKIARDWQIVLDRRPEIKYFRMSDFIKREGPFEKLTTDEANAKLDSLVCVLEAHGQSMAWIESIITFDIFNHALNEEERNYFKSPYYFCVSGILNGCRELLKGNRLPVHFTFDAQDGLDLVILEMFNLVKTGLPSEETWLLHEVGFADDRVIVPLQCADLLAWHVRRDYLQLPEDHGRPRPEYIRLHNSISKPKVKGRWDEKKLAEAMRKH
jgi:hypothetical protein